MYNFIDTIKKDFKSDSNLTEIEKIIFNVILMHIKDLVFLMKVEDNRKSQGFYFSKAVSHREIEENYLCKDKNTLF